MGVKFLLLSVVLMSTYIALGEAVDTQGLTEQDILFNCNRFGQDCGNSGTCEEDGTCSCSVSNSGPSCLYDVHPGGTCSDITCENGGVCSLKDGEEKCACKSIDKGTECSEDRIEVECVGENVVITIDLLEYGLSSSNFSGIVYLGLNNSDSSCTLTPDGGSPGIYNEQSFSITDETLCDGWKEWFNDTVNDIEGHYYSKQLTIQFSPDYIDANDVTLNLTCFHSSDDTVVVSGRAEISVVADDGAVKDADDTIKVAYIPVEFGIFDNDNNELSEDGTEVEVGDDVYLDLKLTDLDVYKGMAVDNCVVSDEDAGKSLTIIQSLCITDAAAKIMDGPSITKSSNPGYILSIFTMTVFRLTESTTTLTVECEVNLCKDENSTRCEEPTCDGARRRRRRAAGDEELEVQKTSAQIKIASSEVSIITSEGENKECETPESTKISLISLAVVCVILLVVSLTLVYFLIRNRNAPAKSFPQLNDIAIARFGVPENSITKNAFTNKAYE